MMKVFLISLVVLVVIFVVGCALSAGLTVGERLTIAATGNYPKRMRVMGGLLVLSFIETVISLIVWIVNM